MSKKLVIKTLAFILLFGILFYFFANGSNIPFKTSNNKLTVSGVIRDGESNPIVAAITIVDTNDQIIKRTTSHLDGSFSVGLKNTSYTVIFSKGPEYEIAKRFINIDGHIFNTNITLNRLINLNELHWYSGEIHQHSNKSDDGTMGKDQVFRYNLSRGLRFASVTDHNHFFNQDYEDTSKPFLTISGVELTTQFGDYNIYNGKTPLENQFDSYEAFKKMIEQMDGNVIKQINHPFKEDAPFKHWGDVAMFDTLELWHGIFPYSHETNLRAKNKWFDLLNRGHKLFATSGSDNHYLDRIYLLNREETIYADQVTQYSEIPMLYVYTEHFTKNGIIKGIKSGNSFITNGPLILARIDDQVPGSHISSQNSVSLVLHVMDQLGLSKINVIKNGVIVETLTSSSKELRESIDLTVEKGDWVVIESYSQHNGYAITNPFYIH